MQTQNLTWEDLRVLLAVSRASSFLAAGRTLGLSTSTVARRIGVLETHLRSRIVRRTASGTTIEPGASSLVELAARIESELAVATRDLSAAPEELAGTVRVSVGEGFVRLCARVAAAFRREHPRTFVELAVDQRVADLPKREADIAIRTVKSTSDTVVTRKLGELRYALYASDEYLRRARSARATRDDIPAHDFVIYEGFLERQPEVRWLRERGAVRFPFRASNTDGILEGALCGQGVAALPVLLADGVPTLRRIRAEEELPSKPVFLAIHRDMRSVPRVRALAEALANEFTRALSGGASSRPASSASTRRKVSR
jgi:DNA-binding transcriptional LysR family regulator